ncbi:hypothetical protein RF240_00935 [Dickeya dadantii]|uniref:hypothetical protein n=1 Tax=Dickeya dadantii TaxID=204038 RepID=UPI001115803B|nr:hypothetical protein [Dickeya dadantii]NPE63502.1 hypothetical protein [Dickeya dadantii]UAY94736.1 hypothetical protein KTF62_12790 [Dickeya dadantii]
MSNTDATHHDPHHDGIPTVQPTRRPDCATSMHMRRLYDNEENDSWGTQPIHFSLLKVVV